MKITTPQTPARVDRSPSAVNWTPATSSSTESTPIEQPWALPEIRTPGAQVSSSQALAEVMATTPTAEASILASAHRSPSAVEWTPATSSSTESTPIEQPWSLPEARTPAAPLASAKALADVLSKTPTIQSIDPVLASAHRSPSAVEWTPAASSSTESTPIEQPWALPEARTPAAPLASAKALADVVAKTPTTRALQPTAASALTSAHRSPSAVEWTPAASSSTESTPIEQPWSVPEVRTPAAPLASAKALADVVSKTPTNRTAEPAAETWTLASAHRSPSAVEWTPAASTSPESTPIEQPWALPEVRVSSPTTPTAPASSRALADIVEGPSPDLVKGTPAPISAHRSPSAVDWTPEPSSSNESTPIEQPWSLPEGKVSTPATASSASARALAKAMESSPSSESYTGLSEDPSEYESPINSSGIPFLIISSPSPAVSETESSPEIVYPARGSAEGDESEVEDYESDNETATVASAAVLAAAVTFSETQNPTYSSSKPAPEDSTSTNDILGSPVILRSVAKTDPESPLASPDLDNHETTPLKSALKKDDTMSAFRSPSAVHWTPATSSSTESSPIEQPWALPESKAREPSTPSAPAPSARALANVLDQSSKSQVALSAQRSPSAVNWTPEATSSTESTPIEQPWALSEHQKTPKTPVAPAASSRTLADVVKTPLKPYDEAFNTSASRVPLSAHRSPSAIEWTPQPSSSTESTPIEQPWALPEIKMLGTPAAPAPSSRALAEVMKTPEPSELKTVKGISISLSGRRSPSAVNWTPEPSSSNESSPVEQPWALPERKMSIPTTPIALASSRALAEVADVTVTIATPAPLSVHRSPSAVDWTPQPSSSTESTPVAQPWALPESQISAPSTPLLAPAESSRALAEVIVTPRANSIKFVKATPIVLSASRSPSAVQWTPAPSSSAESSPIDQPWALPESEMPETPVDPIHSSRALGEMAKTPSVDVLDVDELDSDHEFSISKATRVPMSAHRSPSAIHWTPELSSSTESTPIEQPWSLPEGRTPSTPAAPAPSSRALAEVMGTPIAANPRDSHVHIATATAVGFSLRAPTEEVSVPLSAHRSPSAVNWSPEPSSSTESTPIAQPWSLPEGKSVPNTPAVAAPSSAALAKALESDGPSHRESLVIEPVLHVELAFRSPSAVMWSPEPASSSEASPIAQPWTMKEEIPDSDHEKTPSVPAVKIAPLTFTNSSTATLTTSQKSTHVEGLLPAASFTIAAAAAVAAAQDEPKTLTESDGFSSAHSSPEAVSKTRFVYTHDSEDALSDAVIHSPEQASPAKSVSSSDTFASATQANSPSHESSNGFSPVETQPRPQSPLDYKSSHQAAYESSVTSESNINDSVSPEHDSFSVDDASQLTAATTATPSKAEIESLDDSLLSYKGDQPKNVLESPLESIPLHSMPTEDQKPTFESFPDMSVNAQSKASEPFNFGNTSPQTSWSLQESSGLSVMSRDTSSQSPESVSSAPSINAAGFTFLNPSEDHTSKAVNQVLATPQNFKLEISLSPESTEQVHARTDSLTAEGDMFAARNTLPETPRGPVISRSTTQTSFVTDIEDDTLSSKNPVSSSIENTPMGNGLPPFSTASVERSLEDDWFALPRTGVSALTPEYADSPLEMSPAAPPPRSPDASFLFPLSKSTPVLGASAAAGVAGVPAGAASEKLLPSLPTQPTKPTDQLISKSILSAEIDNDKASQVSSDNSASFARSRIPSVTLKPIVKEETRNLEDADDTIFAVCVVGFHHSR